MYGEAVHPAGKFGGKEVCLSRSKLEEFGSEQQKPSAALEIETQDTLTSIYYLLMRIYIRFMWPKVSDLMFKVANGIVAEIIDDPPRG